MARLVGLWHRGARRHGLPHRQHAISGIGARVPDECRRGIRRIEPRNGKGDLGMKLEWITAAKGGPPAMSSFAYAGLLTETILLGNLAIRVGKKIEWDGPNMRATNCPEAAQFIAPTYRAGWTL